MISAMVCAAHKVSTFFQVGCWECRHFLPTFVKSLEQRIRRKKKKTANARISQISWPAKRNDFKNLQREGGSSAFYTFFVTNDRDLNVSSSH